MTSGLGQIHFERIRDHGPCQHHPWPEHQLPAKLMLMLALQHHMPRRIRVTRARTEFCDGDERIA